MDNKQGNDELRELAIFAGAGGGLLAGQLLGWKTICAVELNKYARSVLVQRQNDGSLAPFPIWDDIRTFDGKPWRGYVDVVSGGFPCQDISAAGKGAGITGERSGLWGEMARIIREIQPQFAFVENSPMLTSRGLGVVLGDLAEMGYDARWCVLGASHVGAPHKRERIWILADADSKQRSESHTRAKRHGGSIPIGSGTESRGDVADTDSRRHNSSGKNRKAMADAKTRSEIAGWWEVEPTMGRVADGVSHRVDRLKAIGNGQVPKVAALAWNMLRYET